MEFSVRLCRVLNYLIDGKFESIKMQNKKYFQICNFEIIRVQIKVIDLSCVVQVYISISLREEYKFWRKFRLDVFNYSLVLSVNLDSQCCI